VENDLTTDMNGSGVGLYLTQQIVQRHKGTIAVRSVLGKGSTFIVRFPVEHGVRTVLPQKQKT
jgi:signal transduction histidine kinase